VNITPHNLIYHELIGLEAEVAASTNPCQQGIKGKVVDETKNMLVLENMEGRVLRIAKSQASFVFNLPPRVKVDGRLLAYQPWDRVQNRFRKRIKR